MKKEYPILIKKRKDFFVVDIPDFEISTQGKDLLEAIEMARDAIEAKGSLLLKQSKELPKETPIWKIKTKPYQTRMLIEVDFPKF